MAGMVRTKLCLRCLCRSSNDIQQLKLASRNTHSTFRSASTLVRRLQLASSEQLKVLPARIQLVKTFKTNPQKPRPAGSGGPISWKFVAGLVIFGGFYVAIFRYLKQSKEKAKQRDYQRSVGKAALGGDWTLVDHTGKTKTNNDFKGKWTILYFGFTHCPDICPDEIEKMVETIKLLDEMKGPDSVLPIFISVDPERDSVEAVSAYIKEFSPKLIGLTGSKEQVETICRAYRVFYSMGPKDEDDDYIVDHTIVMYLINPDGEFVEFFGRSLTPMDICNRTIMSMYKYDVEQKQK